MRTIDADALIEKCGGWYVDECTESGFIGTLENLLATEPTVQPEPPIIKCKDCKWWRKQKDSAQGRCRLLGIYPTGGWYCANGARERRTDD